MFSGIPSTDDPPLMGDFSELDGQVEMLWMLHQYHLLTELLSSICLAFIDPRMVDTETFELDRWE